MTLTTLVGATDAILSYVNDDRSKQPLDLSPLRFPDPNVFVVAFVEFDCNLEFVGSWPRLVWSDWIDTRGIASIRQIGSLVCSRSRHTRWFSDPQFACSLVDNTTVQSQAPLLFRCLTSLPNTGLLKRISREI